MAILAAGLEVKGALPEAPVNDNGIFLCGTTRAEAVAIAIELASTRSCSNLNRFAARGGTTAAKLLVFPLPVCPYARRDACRPRTASVK